MGRLCEGAKQVCWDESFRTKSQPTLEKPYWLWQRVCRCSLQDTKRPETLRMDMTQVELRVARPLDPMRIEDSE